MMRLTSHCPGPGSMYCILLMAANEFAQIWTLVQGGSVRCLLVPRPVRTLCRAISRGSPITYSSVSNNSLLVHRYVLCDRHSVFYNDPLAPMRSDSSIEPSAKKDISPGRWVYLLDTFCSFLVGTCEEGCAFWKGLRFYPLGMLRACYGVDAGALRNCLC